MTKQRSRVQSSWRSLYKLYAPSLAQSDWIFSSLQRYSPETRPEATAASSWLYIVVVVVTGSHYMPFTYSTHGFYLKVLIDGVLEWALGSCSPPRPRPFLSGQTRIQNVFHFSTTKLGVLLGTSESFRNGFIPVSRHVSTVEVRREFLALHSSFRSV